jgi:exocyst complex component 1
VVGKVGFSPVPTPLTAKGAVGLRRAGTLIKSPIEGRQRDREKHKNGDLRASEVNLILATSSSLTDSQVFGMFLEQMASLIYHEHDFLTDFLQFNDAGLTFADYMGLDNYFGRQAARSTSLSQATMKLVRGALDLIFGFLPAELKSWFEAVLERDRM